MRRRNSLIWKLSVVVLAIVSLVILAGGWLGSILSKQYALNAARNVMQFNSLSIKNGIEELMMSRNCIGARTFIGEMSQQASAFEDVSLIAHPSGRISVSYRKPAGTFLEQDNRTCLHCHRQGGPPALNGNGNSELMMSGYGDRILQVVTPILNRSDCSSADCHIHAEAGPVLGILQTDYSLSNFNHLMTQMNIYLALAAAVAIGLTILALLLMFRALLARPLRSLVAGVGSLAAGDLGFRFPVKDEREQDEFGLVEGSFNDMAAQLEKQQREIRRGLEYLEAIVENTADLVITVNTDGFIQTFNRGAEQALGYDRNDVIGKRVEMLFANPEEREKAIAKLQGQDNVTNWKTHFKTRNGQVRHILLTLSYLRDRRGNLIGTLGISKDITRVMELQEKLIRTEQEAAIGRAVTGIQHAIKNMLNTLRGGLYVVRVGLKKNQENRITEGSEMIEEGLNRISDLSHSMLRYAREWKIDPEPVDLSDMALKIAQSVGQNAKERGVMIQTEIAESMPDVPCDPRLIHMCLMDIVSNAVDACEMKDYDWEEQPTIVMRVYTAVVGRKAVIEIEDNGIGMSKEVAESVFTPFFSTKKKWGTGLGLALTERIIDLHEGKIIVESEPDKGATFRITLPLER